MQDEGNKWERQKEKRLENIRSRLSKANPLNRRKKLFSLKFRRRFSYTFFGLSALFIFLYYTDPTIFFRTQIGIMALVGQFLYSFSVLYGQLMSLIPDAYVPFVDAYWNIAMSVLVLVILCYLYYVVRRQRADFIFKTFQIVVLVVILSVLSVFQLNKDPTVFGKVFDRVTDSQDLSEKIRSDFVGYSLEDRLKIQSGLKDYGYYSTVDGLFGNATFLAVQTYMKQNDIASYKKGVLDDIVDNKFEKKFKIKKVNGQFFSSIFVNDVEVEVLIDTGASHTTISFEEAIRAGIPTKSLAFIQEVETANGKTYVASKQVKSLRWLGYELGPRMIDVSKQGDLSISLLGMDVLKKFNCVSISGNSLIISK